MDPDANLKEQRELRRDLESLVERYNTDVARGRGGYELADSIQDKTGRLLELMEGLDNWLATGGFLPADWAEKR